MTENETLLIEKLIQTIERLESKLDQAQTVTHYIMPQGMQPTYVQYQTQPVEDNTTAKPIDHIVYPEIYSYDDFKGTYRTHR